VCFVLADGLIDIKEFFPRNFDSRSTTYRTD